MFKWRRRRPKGNQADRDLEEAVRVLEDAEFGDYLGLHGRRSGSSGPGSADSPDVGTSSDPTFTSPGPSPNDDSDRESAPRDGADAARRDS